jgi:hypothetical protein
MGGSEMKRQPILAYAQLNIRIKPIARGKRFETPLMEALAENGLGEVGGGGTMQSKEGEIEFCGIDVDLFDTEKCGPFVCQFLMERGAPKGSVLRYELDGRKVELPFGNVEGLAIYLNGTDLGDEVYKECDVNVVIDTISRLLGNRGAILENWQGPRETALYLYGKSADQMRGAILGFLGEYPLCQKARVERIA